MPTPAFLLTRKQVKSLLKKAYEWRAKTNKRHNRLNCFKTNRTIIRLKIFLKCSKRIKFIPTKNEVELIIAWFLRCPPKNKVEIDIFIRIGLISKLHPVELK